MNDRTPALSHGPAGRVMNAITDAYFGWTELQHDTGCSRPVWEVDTRTDYSVPRGGTGHRCAEHDCGHGDRMDRVTVRIVCRACEVARVITGESHVEHITRTRELGYGEPLGKAAGGLWLYPGPPLRRGQPPHDYLVTAKRVHRPEPGDVIGYIHIDPTARSRRRYRAAALPVPGDGGFWFKSWRVEATELFTNAHAAAEWIAEQLPPS